jgi:acyl-CoA reductase-like NAD-dependent aldehyde dehydrogenase
MNDIRLPIALQLEKLNHSLSTLVTDAFVEYVPLGVLGVIAPWNYPVSQHYL